MANLLKPRPGDPAEPAMALWDGLSESDREAGLPLTYQLREELDRRWADTSQTLFGDPLGRGPRKASNLRWSPGKSYSGRRLEMTQPKCTHGAKRAARALGESAVRRSVRRWFGLQRTRLRSTESTVRCAGRSCQDSRMPTGNRVPDRTAAGEARA